MAKSDEFKQYERKVTMGELRPYVPGEDLTGITVEEGHTPVEGDMIARNPKDRDQQWLVDAKYFAANYNPDPMDFDRPSRREDF